MGEYDASDEIAAMLSQVIVDRAHRGNGQSKHGMNAAISYEVYLLGRAIEALMDEPPGSWTPF